MCRIKQLVRFCAAIIVLSCGGRTDLGGRVPVDAAPDVAGSASCDETCDGTCKSAGCLVTLAVQQEDPVGIAVDATGVYWTNFTSGTVMRVALTGGALTTLAAEQANPYGIAVDGSSVYWTTLGGMALNGGGVMKVALGGGSLTVLASGQTGAANIAVDATTVYWGNRLGGAGALMKVAIAGGAPTTLAAGQSVGYSGPEALVLNASSVFWTNDGPGGSVMKIALDGGMPTTLATAREYYPGGLCVDGASVYWTDSLNEQGAVREVSVDGGGVAELASLQSSPGAIVVVRSPAALYWANRGRFSFSHTGEIVRMPEAGGLPDTLASEQDPSAIAVDATSVYWTNAPAPSQTASGSVVKLQTTCACR